MNLNQYNTGGFCFGNQVQRVNAAAFASGSKSACELRTDVGVGTRNNKTLVDSDERVLKGSLWHFALSEHVVLDVRTTAVTRCISFSVFAEKTLNKSRTWAPG